MLAELPWLLENGVTGKPEPSNPTVGPRLTIVRAGIAPPGAFKRYVAVSVSSDGGFKYDFVARTPATEGEQPVWDVALSLGEAARAWGDKAKLKLLFLEETTLVTMRSSTFIGMVIVTLAELRAAHTQQEQPLQRATIPCVRGCNPMRDRGCNPHVCSLQPNACSLQPYVSPRSCCSRTRTATPC